MMRGTITPDVKACASCGKGFLRTHGPQKYCSTDCSRNGERKSWREYGKRNSEARAEYRHEHYQVTRDRVLQRTRAYQQSAAGKRAQRASAANQRAKAAERVAARVAVSKATRRGALVPLPCASCGATPTQAHHQDYSRPLDVTWLCAPCHVAEHNAERARRRAEAKHIKGTAPAEPALA